MNWTLRHGLVDFSKAPLVMGVINVTPDSFADGGRYQDADAALAHANTLVAEGAAILDLGAESTRPGSAPVDPDEQRRRLDAVLPAIRRQHPLVPISVDTRAAAVAARAIDLGADIINDVSALRDDPDMPGLARRTNTPVILMHMRGQPQTMQHGDLAYDDVVGDVLEFLNERAAFAQHAGLPRDRIAIDPGIGFGKTVQHNLSLLRHAGAFVQTGYPVVIGASRKSFIGAVLDQPDPANRVVGSVACAVAAALAGVHILRVHDAAPTVQALRLAHAIRSAP